ncbi:ELMO domain-containing protein 3-like [Cynoglossus semilaevis]|uniref:ELMO domain-containing protein 3-like n=1 Tax=Cynoglossus semilaevis TaxID=244447 RepID=UPI0007DC9683|nr:ELMO domain-containing protein 3-like [Cynoglossus semilaevis]
MEEDIDVTSHVEGLDLLSSRCNPLEEITNGYSKHKPVMNGVIIGHGVNDHTNGSATLRSLPISALKQNGLLQSLAATGGEQTKLAAEENAELEKARQEWEVLENVQPALTEDSNPSPLISFNEALQYFQTTDLGDLLVRNRFITDDVCRGDRLAGVVGVGGVTKHHDSVKCETMHPLPLARDVYKLSQHPTQNFPFSVMSINMTRIALQVLREEALSKECNRRQQVVGVLNEFYVATYLYLYQLWKTQNKTIADSGFVLKEVELFAKKNPRQMLRRLQVFLKERQTVGLPHGASSSDPSPSPWEPGSRARAAPGN